MSEKNSHNREKVYLLSTFVVSIVCFVLSVGKVDWSDFSSAHMCACIFRLSFVIWSLNILARTHGLQKFLHNTSIILVSFLNLFPGCKNGVNVTRYFESRKQIFISDQV